MMRRSAARTATRVRTQGSPFLSVDLGLALTARFARRGVSLPQWFLAAFCGVSKQAIQQIEAKALRKLREAAAGDPQLRECFAELLELQCERRPCIPAPRGASRGFGRRAA